MHIGNRKATLIKLIQDPELSRMTKMELDHHEWDCEKPLTTLELHHIANALSLYMRDNISDADLEFWANAIECREDIEYDPIHSELIGNIIYELANPILTTPITKDMASKLLTRCR